ncbi:hypothetical protein AB0A77_16885 [Streptomyces varsoviensis]|uniref:alpha/beta hydrolase family protein n=1 Tax=Streptomyces varsoviensis TaxID=67373 RepID=UPI003401C6A2
MSNRLVLPAPGGPYPVGTRAFPLLAPGRADPWQAGRRRELMVQVWYPAAARTEDAPAARYLTPSVAAHVLRMWAEEGEEFGPEVEEALAGVRVHAVDGAPVASGPPVGSGLLVASGPPWPLVLFSPGLGEYRAGLTALAEDLASRGYVVASVDHPGDAAAVEFPDGRLVPHREPEGGAAGELETHYLPTRVADLQFVLDRLLAPGSPWHGLLDPARIGVAGHSLGGAAAAELARVDAQLDAQLDARGDARIGSRIGSRIDARLGARLGAVAVLDGSLYGQVLTTGLDLPVLLCGLTPTDPADPDILAGWDRLWPLLRGPRRHTTVPGAGHMSATDFDALAEPLGLRDPNDPADPADPAAPANPADPADVDPADVDPDDVDPDDVFTFGTLPSGHGIASVRAVLAAFFSEHLLDDRPSQPQPQPRPKGAGQVTSGSTPGAEPR